MKKRRMPDKLLPLAEYNTERTRGLEHTRDYKKQMARLQEEYNAWGQPRRPWFFGWDYW